MSFDLLERSVFGGKPLELYEFGLLGQYWRYTTEDRIVNFNFADFVPAPGLKRSAIRVTQNIERGDLQVYMRGSSEIAREYLIAPPSEPVTLKIYQKHRDDPGYIIRWRGQVKNCLWDNDCSQATIMCTQANWSLRQPGLRRAFQYNCPYDLYGAGCGVDRSAFEVLATVTGISGLLVTLTLPGSYVDGYFAGGYMLWEGLTGRRETRMVTSSTGNTITSQLSTIGLSVGDALRVYPGCDHTPQMCYEKFANMDNFGGQPFIPETNPFAGATIF